MKKTITTLRIFGLLGLVAWSLSVTHEAHAHYLWMETPPSKDQKATQKIEIYYGEFEESLREVSGGRLDKVEGLHAWWTGTDNQRREITLEKKSNFFFGTVKGAKDSIIQAEELNLAVTDLRKYEIGIVKPNLYASAYVGDSTENLSAPQSKTTLGIYPIQLGEEIVLKVFFKDEALPNAKVNIHAPNTWSKEFNTDASGMVRFKPPWTGQHVAEVIYLGKTAGEFKGVPYEAIRHRATFTWNIKEGSQK